MHIREGSVVFGFAQQPQIQTITFFVVRLEAHCHRKISSRITGEQAWSGAANPPNFVARTLA